VLLYLLIQLVLRLAALIIQEYHLSATCKIASGIRLSRLTPYADETPGDQRVLGQNMSTSDQIFCIHQILQKECEHNETALHLFIDFKKAFDSEGSVAQHCLYVRCTHESNYGN
jgi:hypothetical protein